MQRNQVAALCVVSDNWPSDGDGSRPPISTGAGIAIGVGIGAALSVATGTTLWIVLGVVFGIAFANGMRRGN